MRTLLPFVAVILIGGCAGTGGDRPNAAAGMNHDTPVVLEHPSLSERQRANRQRRAEQETVGVTDVRGNLTR